MDFQEFSMDFPWIFQIFPWKFPAFHGFRHGLQLGADFDSIFLCPESTEAPGLTRRLQVVIWNYGCEGVNVHIYRK